MTDDQPLWTPSPARIAGTRLQQFVDGVRTRLDVDVADSVALQTWSVEHQDEFWSTVWNATDVIGDRGQGPAYVPGATFPEARYFPGARLNLAENLLRRTGADPAIVFEREDGQRRVLSADQLRAAVASTAAALVADGVQAGDRVVAWMPNVPETVIAMLAATSIGAVFSSTSADFGPAGVVDRFGQIEPVVLFAADGYLYGGKRFDCLGRLGEIRAALPTLRRVVVSGNLAEYPDVAGVPDATTFARYTDPYGTAALEFNRLPFDHPAYVLFSSGTTGKPKCIVHRAGGVLLMQLKEQQLSSDIRAGDVVFYFTTCGWMMWNWLVSALASEATIVLFDGNPFHPTPSVLFDVVDRHGVTLMGVSAKFIDSVRKAGLRPLDSHRLAWLRTICSTGSPLSPEGFAWVYEAVKTDVHLASISGGTDLCGCFVGGDPTRPVFSGEIQGPALGLAVDVYDEAGKPVGPGVKGELVCTEPFPSVPIGFWGDDDGSRFRAAYFERFPGVWAHGDFAAWTERGGMVIYGRSDATLNAGGVRIGTAEIYREVEQLDEIAEAIAVGQEWEGDTRIVLFVRLADGAELSDDLQATIRRRLREHCSPRHVPARIVAVADIPRTRSNKIVELAVADIVNGREVRNRDALANPEALDLFRDLPELKS